MPAIIPYVDYKLGSNETLTSADEDLDGDIPTREKLSLMQKLNKA